MLGTNHLTDTPGSHNITARGMAHFAGTGPAGKHCRDCWFKGYNCHVKNRHGISKSSRSEGCEKFYRLTGEHGPAVRGDLHACRHFLERPKS
jgi:hypothetical protein